MNDIHLVVLYLERFIHHGSVFSKSQLCIRLIFLRTAALQNLLQSSVVIQQFKTIIFWSIMMMRNVNRWYPVLPDRVSQNQVPSS